MDAERKLDRLIAERILGCRVSQDIDYDGCRCPSRAHAVEHRDHGASLYSLKRYSTDTPAALEVFEHLRKSGKWCCLEIKADFNYCWDVILTEYTPQSNHKPSIVVTRESLPLAICIAALKAYGVET